VVTDLARDKLGRVVWHDLFTPDLERARIFYHRIAGWNYVSEHAEDFTWGGGERDYVLALLSGEAGAGLIEGSVDPPSGWVPYVEVQCVDRAAELAASLGAKILKPPVEVEGVGRNCLLEDPCGAVFGVSLSRHAFPRPTMQFGPEVYLTGARGFPGEFYRRLLSWRFEPDQADQRRGRVVCTADVVVAEVGAAPPGVHGDTADWIPSLRGQARRALSARVSSLAGAVYDPSMEVAFASAAAMIGDPGGAISVVFEDLT